MNGLRECLEAILRTDVPEPEGDPVYFFRGWLAERNLGLVPIGDPSSFSWPGYWIAQSGGGAVLMYGSPSGPVDGELPGRIEAGLLVAPLDLHLGISEPYGTDAGVGSVAGILVAPEAEAPMRVVESTKALAGRGLAGDRYVDDRGTFHGPRGYQLTVVAAEALEEADVTWEQARRNVVTRGLDVNALVGRRFRIGEVECIGRRLAEPCAHLEKVSGSGIMRPLVHRAGLRADILSDGTISVGDPVATVSG
jgi:hypothetical protein